MILYSDPLYEWVRKRKLLTLFRAGDKDPKGEETVHERKDHIIVVGINALGRAIIEHLHQAGQNQMLAIDVDPEKLQDLPCETMLGNVEYLSVLEEAGLAKARLVISALQIEDTNHLLAYQARSRGIPCAIHAFDLSVIDDLVELDVNYLMYPRVEGLKYQTDELKRMGILPQ